MPSPTSGSSPPQPHRSRSTTALELRNAAPGPGSYSPNKLLFKPHEAHASFGKAARIAGTGGQSASTSPTGASPGPATFMKTMSQQKLWTNHAGKARNGAVFRTEARKLLSIRTDLPGPGDYSPYGPSPSAASAASSTKGKGKGGTSREGWKDGKDPANTQDGNDQSAMKDSKGLDAKADEKATQSQKQKARARSDPIPGPSFDRAKRFAAAAPPSNELSPPGPATYMKTKAAGDKLWVQPRPWIIF